MSPHARSAEKCLLDPSPCHSQFFLLPPHDVLPLGAVSALLAAAAAGEKSVGAPPTTTQRQPRRGAAASAAQRHSRRVRWGGSESAPRRCAHPRQPRQEGEGSGPWPTCAAPPREPDDPTPPPPPYGRGPQHNDRPLPCALPWRRSMSPAQPEKIDNEDNEDTELKGQ